MHKVPLPSATATQFRSAAASHKIPDRQWRGAPAPVGFAPSRRGRGRRVSRSQVKVQTRRITGPAPRPRRCKRLRVGDMRRTFSNPHSKTVSAAWERLPYNRTPSGEGQPKILLRRAIGFQAPALAASQPKDGERALQCQRKVIPLTGIAKNRKRKIRKNITYTHKKPFA